MTNYHAKFQQRHYEFIAAAIKDTKTLRPRSEHGALIDLERILVDHFLADNPNFKPAQFIAACAAKED